MLLLKNGSSTSTLIEIKACEELLGQKKQTNISNKTRETVFKLEGAKLSELTMVNPILIVVVVLITASIGPYMGTSFALHDSTLGVNTWLASDNSTQLNTIDLNNGPTAPTADAGGAAETEDEVVEDEEVDEEPEETPTDENETDGEDE